MYFVQYDLYCPTAKNNYFQLLQNEGIDFQCSSQTANKLKPEIK